MKENKFQANLIKDIKKEFSGCIVLKNDSSYMQGVPDLLVLHNDKWATLEVKRNKTAKHQPNQDYYVKKMNDMSYSAFIYPENRDKIMSDLRKVFKE